MRRNFVLLMLCLSLTYGSAFALNYSGSVIPVTNPNSMISPSKDYSQGGKLIYQQIGLPSNQPEINTKEDLINMYKQKKAREKELLYTALGFTTEQKAKAEALEAEAKAGVAERVKKFRVEQKKLKHLKAKKASRFRIWLQKSSVKSAKKDVIDYVTTSRKAFDDILTAEQKTRFKKINEEKIKEMKRRKNGFSFM